MEVVVVNLTELSEYLKNCFFLFTSPRKYYIRLANIRMFGNIHYHPGCGK